MIRLANLKNAGAVGRTGLRQLFPSSTARLAARSFSASGGINDGDKGAIRGIPYSKLTVGVPKERYPLEKRVAATPEVSVKLCNSWSLELGVLNIPIFTVNDYILLITRIIHLKRHQSVSKLTKPGFSVLIEKGAGSSSHFSDADYEAAGAKVVDAAEVWKKSDIVLKVSVIYHDFTTKFALASDL